MLCKFLQTHQKKGGRSLKRTHCKRHPVPSGKQVAYQLPGIQGSLSSLKIVPRPLHTQDSTCSDRQHQGPWWQSGNTLASHLCGWGSIPVMAVSGKAGSCLPLVGSLQYRTLAKYMYCFPLPFQLPIVI